MTDEQMSIAYEKGEDWVEGGQGDHRVDIVESLCIG